MMRVGWYATEYSDDFHKSHLLYRAGTPTGTYYAASRHIAHKDMARIIHLNRWRMWVKNIYNGNSRIWKMLRGNTTSKISLKGSIRANCEFVFFSWKEIARFLSIQSGAHTRKTESKSAENPTLQSLRLERRRLTIRSLPKMSHPLTLFVTPSKTQRARPMLMKNPRRSCFSSLCLWIYAARNPHIYQEMCTRLSALTFVLLCPRSDKNCWWSHRSVRARNPLGEWKVRRERSTIDIEWVKIYLWERFEVNANCLDAAQDRYFYSLLRYSKVLNDSQGVF